MPQESDSFLGCSRPAVPHTILDGLSYVRQSSVFEGLSPAEIAPIASSSQARKLVRGETLFREGEPVRHVSLLCSGRMKVTQLGPGGHQVILRLKVPGDIVSELGLPLDSVHSSSAEALEPSQILLWSLATFHDLSDRFPLLHRNIARLLAGRLQQLEERFRELATEQVAPRLARTLVRLLQHVGRPTEGAVRVDLSRDELAQMTGTTLFTVSRLLSQWEECDIVHATRGAVVVQDVRRLAELTESS